MAAGTYVEDVEIKNKIVKLISADPTTTVIQGFSQVVLAHDYSTAGQVEVANFTITGGANSGVRFWSNSSAANLLGYVHNCIVVNNSYGIMADNANVRVSNSVIASSSDTGAYTSNYGSMGVTGNIIMNNTRGAYADGACDRGMCPWYGCAWATQMSYFVRHLFWQYE